MSQPARPRPRWRALRHGRPGERGQPGTRIRAKAIVARRSSATETATAGQPNPGTRRRHRPGARRDTRSRRRRRRPRRGPAVPGRPVGRRPTRDHEEDRPEDGDGGEGDDRHRAVRSTTLGDDSERVSPAILHVDLDAFFASVEQRDHPELRGRPVIVGGGDREARGVVSAASYEARRFGVHSAMSLREAGRPMPDGVFVPRRRPSLSDREPGRHGGPAAVHPLVEPISIDEAFLDVTASAGLFGDGPTIGTPDQGRGPRRRRVDRIGRRGDDQARREDRLGPAQARRSGRGVAGEESAFLAPLPIGRLWGVGERTASRPGASSAS